MECNRRQQIKHITRLDILRFQKSQSQKSAHIQGDNRDKYPKKWGENIIV